MILADTSIWIDHLRAGDPVLSDLLAREQVVIHRYVISEVALGRLRARETVLDALKSLPAVVEAASEEVLHLIERHDLSGSGIGYVDVHLLAAVYLTPGSRIWTRDKRLQQVAERLGLAARPAVQ